LKSLPPFDSTTPQGLAEGNLRLPVFPARVRIVYWVVICSVCICAGWAWLGNSGAGLITLWCSALRPWHREPFELTLDVAEVSGCIVTPWHIVVNSEGRNTEVFRDELSRHDWALLRSTLRLAVTSS